MLDSDIAVLYGVSTKALLQAVKRNIDRFPSDFAFRLTPQELSNLRSQSVTSRSSGWGGRRFTPYVFTEHGVAMLSSVLRSSRAIAANIAIMRAFVHLRGMVAANAELSSKLEQLERRISRHDQALVDIVKAIRELTVPEAKPERPIGFVST